MKKVIILLAIVLVGFSSVLPKTTMKGYYKGYVIDGQDTIVLGNRTRFDLAKDDVDNYLDQSSLEHGFITAPYWEVYRPNTGNAIQKEIVYKDTIEKGVIVIQGNIYNSIHRKYRYTYHKYGNQKYLVDKRIHGDQPTQYRLDTVYSYSSDSSQVIRKYFFSKHWKFSKREHDNLDSLLVMEFNEFQYTPGFQDVLVIRKDTFFNLRRNTHAFKKKYYQVRAKDTTYNTIDTLKVQWNPYY